MLSLCASVMNTPEEVEGSSFSDAALIADWARPFVDYVSGVGMMTVSYTHLDVYKRQVVDRALQSRARAAQKVKPGAGDLGGGVRVQDAERAPDVPVGLRCV